MNLLKKIFKDKEQNIESKVLPIIQQSITNPMNTDEENRTEEERNIHNNTISNRYITHSDYSDHDLDKLSIQDLCVLVNNTKYALNNQIFLDGVEHLELLLSKFYNLLVSKIQNADIIYTIIDNNTGYPYIDENAQDSVWLFSRKKYAENAVDFYTQQYRSFSIQEIKNESFKEFFADLYLIGAYGIYMDNGLVGCAVKKEDLLEAPNWGDTPTISIPVTNPEFMLAHLKMSQELAWNVNYPDRNEVLGRLELELCRKSLEARFLVPTKGMPQGDSSEASEVTLQKDTNISIPFLEGKDGTHAIPAFTDWKQFHIIYTNNDYSGWIMTFKDLTEMIKSSNHNAFVINVGKCPMDVTSKSLDRIKEVLNITEV
ncbi:SseB family protein [Anaeromicropila herbilytica]|uniref:SseB protein N-terminal domain-containing protein n=1 Tax=Anaeromicropila herbilytica TaxID=2785025 RepID=A0A7R7EL57_9FIRM|nr:SseB family protein [Anaeromicropila herbilytica]BCN30779.1 hypothetical protein bsdtb5_20740 [Anaeromicropila herbilytica]